MNRRNEFVNFVKYNKRVTKGFCGKYTVTFIYIFRFLFNSNDTNVIVVLCHTL